VADEYVPVVNINVKDIIERRFGSGEKGHRATHLTSGKIHAEQFANAGPSPLTSLSLSVTLWTAKAIKRLSGETSTSEYTSASETVAAGNGWS